MLTTIKTSYEDWKTVPRSSGKALCEAPSVAAINGALASPLRWDAAAQGWTGTPEQAEALAAALDARSERILDRYTDTGIAARLTMKQARVMARVAASIREQIAEQQAALLEAR